MNPLLVHIIEKEAQQRGITDYRLVDNRAISPDHIAIATNAVVFVYGMEWMGREAFELTISSSTAVHTYNEQNSPRQGECFYSDMVMSHWEKLSLQTKSKEPYLLKYITLIF